MADLTARGWHPGFQGSSPVVMFFNFSVKIFTAIALPRHPISTPTIPSTILPRQPCFEIHPGYPAATWAQLKMDDISHQQLINITWRQELLVFFFLFVFVGRQVVMMMMIMMIMMKTNMNVMMIITVYVTKSWMVSLKEDLQDIVGITSARKKQTNKSNSTKPIYPSLTYLTLKASLPSTERRCE